MWCRCVIVSKHSGGCATNSKHSPQSRNPNRSVPSPRRSAASRTSWRRPGAWTGRRPPTPSTAVRTKPQKYFFWLDRDRTESRIPPTTTLQTGTSAAGSPRFAACARSGRACRRAIPSTTTARSSCRSATCETSRLRSSCPCTSPRPAPPTFPICFTMAMAMMKAAHPSQGSQRRPLR